MNHSEELNTFEAIRHDSQQAFESLFKALFQPLTAYAFRIVRDLPTAENIVQDVFLKLWQNRHEITITSSIEHYLFRSVRNHGLNYLDKIRVRSEYLKIELEREAENNDYQAYFPEVGLLDKIEKAINALPEKRQAIFRLAREVLLEPILVKINGPVVLSNDTEAVDIAIPQLPPVDELNSEFERCLRIPHELVFVQIEQAIEQIDHRNGGLSNANRGNLIGLHKCDRVVSLEYFCECRCSHPAGCSTPNDNDFKSSFLFHIFHSLGYQLNFTRYKVFNRKAPCRADSTRG